MDGFIERENRSLVTVLPPSIDGKTILLRGSVYACDTKHPSILAVSSMSRLLVPMTGYGRKWAKVL